MNWEIGGPWIQGAEVEQEKYLPRRIRYSRSLGNLGLCYINNKKRQRHRIIFLKILNYDCFFFLIETNHFLIFCEILFYWAQNLAAGKTLQWADFPEEDSDEAELEKLLYLKWFLNWIFTRSNFWELQSYMNFYLVKWDWRLAKTYFCYATRQTFI